MAVGRILQNLERHVMEIVVRNDHQPIASDPFHDRLYQIQIQLACAGLVEGRVLALEALRQRRHLGDQLASRQEDVEHVDRIRRDVPQEHGVFEDQVLQHLVAFVAHRPLQGVERHRRGRDEVLDARRLDGDSRQHCLVPRLEPADLSLQIGERRLLLRRLRATRRLEHPALRIADLRAKQRRLGVQLLLRRPPEAETPRRQQIDERSRSRQLEELERLRILPPLEQLFDRAVVEFRAIVGERTAAALVCQRATIALEARDGVQIRRQRRVVPALHLVQVTFDELHAAGPRRRGVQASAAVVPIAGTAR